MLKLWTIIKKLSPAPVTSENVNICVALCNDKISQIKGTDNVNAALGFLQLINVFQDTTF